MKTDSLRNDRQYAQQEYVCSCHVTRDLDGCEGRYRKRSSLRGMKQERFFCLKTEIFVRNVGVFEQGSRTRMPQCQLVV